MGSAGRGTETTSGEKETQELEEGEDGWPAEWGAGGHRLGWDWGAAGWEESVGAAGLDTGGWGAPEENACQQNEGGTSQEPPET